MKQLMILALAYQASFHVADRCGCPNGWVYFEGSCYHLDHELQVDWTEADNYCSSHGARLLKIDNSLEDIFIQAYCKKVFRTPAKLDEDDSIWTGATDSVTEGIWEWIVDASLVEYSNWAEGQPDSLNNQNQDCLSLYAPDNFTWHDSGCNYRFHPLCEFSLSDPSMSIGK